MTRALLILALAAVALAVGYWGAMQRHADEEDAIGASAAGNGLAWLRTEFDLSPGEFAAIEEHHREYMGICGRHCADIIAAREEFESLRAQNAGETALAAAERRLTELENFCNRATLAHVRNVAALMPPEAGRRFLTLVEPHLAGQAHDGDRGLDR